MSSAPKKKPEYAGVVGFFDDPDTLLSATAKVRDSSFKHFDCFTPFPIHGLEHAQGLARSKVGYVTATLAFTGTATAVAFQYYASKVSWPHIVGGKPFNSLPAFVPIIFELSVLFGGIATFVAMMAFNRLPNLGKKIIDPSLTNNRFAILIECPPEQEEDDFVDAPVSSGPLDPVAAENFLKSLGAKDVRVVRDEGWF